jgi:hypothetical protein
LDSTVIVVCSIDIAAMKVPAWASNGHACGEDCQHPTAKQTAKQTAKRSREGDDSEDETKTKDPKAKAGRPAKTEVLEMNHVRKFHSNSDPADIARYYRRHQVVHIKDCRSLCPSVALDSFGQADLRRLYAGAPDRVEDTFSVETGSETEHGHCAHTADSVLGAGGCPTGSWYTSFIAQGKSTNAAELTKTAETAEAGAAETEAEAGAGAAEGPEEGAVSEFRRALPFAALPLLAARLPIRQTAPVWVFVGRNSSREETLVGRKEHTDDVSHDGTWHYQSQGTKVWYLRPAEAPEWEFSSTVIDKGTGADSFVKFPDDINRLKVVVEEGDILIVNTRLWWHQTRIPYTSKRGLSLSYARDFYCELLRHTLDRSFSLPEQGALQGAGGAGEEGEGEGYTNVDGLYASRAVAAGEVVLTEDEMPDCALPRSEKPNCEVVELEVW